MPDYTREFDEAVERQNLIRDLAFAGDSEKPIPERIGVFEVMPMTMRHFINLRLIRSPFICGGQPTSDNVIAFLWQLSPEYSITNRNGKARFYRRCKRLFVPPKEPVIRFPFLMRRWARIAISRLQVFSDVLHGITEYLEAAMLDAPGGAGTGKAGPSFFSDAAGYCDRLSRAYGWSKGQSLNEPFKVTFQLMKLIDARDRVEAKQRPMWFNKLSGAVTNRMLCEENDRLKEN